MTNPRMACLLEAIVRRSEAGVRVIDFGIASKFRTVGINI